MAYTPVFFFSGGGPTHIYFASDAHDVNIYLREDILHLLCSRGLQSCKNTQDMYTAGKIIIEHVTIFPSKYISKGTVVMTFSPDVGNNSSNPYIQRKQNKYVQKLSYV